MIARASFRAALLTGIATTHATLAYVLGVIAASVLA